MQSRQYTGMTEILHYVGVIFCLLLTIPFKLTAVLHINEFINDFMVYITTMISYCPIRTGPSVCLHVRNRLLQEEIL